MKELTEELRYVIFEGYECTTEQDTTYLIFESDHICLRCTDAYESCGFMHIST